MQPGTLWVRPETTKVSEIIIDPRSRRKTVGKVTRIHEDEDGKPTVREVSVGDRVAFTEYVGVEMEMGGDGLLVLKEEEVLALIGGK